MTDDKSAPQVGNYKNQRQELGIPPAGSVADHHSTQDGSKWHHGVDAVGIAKLGKLATEINSVVDATAKTFAKAQINVGRLLNEARLLIPGDLQFGQWRAANTPITNKSTANKLMNLAKQVGDGRITQDIIDELPMSTLKELISAPDSVLDHVRSQLRDDKTPTREEIRELKSGSAPEEPSMLDDLKAADDEALGGGKPATEPKAAPTLAPRAPASAPKVDVRAEQIKIVAMDQHVRVRLLKDITATSPYPGCKPLEWAWLVLGLDPDPAIVPNSGTLQIIGEALLDGSEDEESHKTITRAIDLILKEEY